MRRIAVLTSGGDAPGMNAAIRGVVRTAIDKGWTVHGVRDGFAGLMAGRLVPLGARDVGGIIQLGGTFLGSARAPEFKDETGQRQALDALARHQIDALIVIGGNGSQAGAHALQRRGFPVVGIASTIDNDLHGADITIGVDTALNVALEALDRLRVTAASHRRVFLVEVMGRDSGYLAVMAGIAGGAELVVIPEVEMDADEVIAGIRELRARGKPHAIVVVAEGARPGVAALSERLARADLGVDLRATTLGHVERGGAPGAFDRLLASRLGAAAVDHIAAGARGVLVGLIGADIAATRLDDVVATPRRLNPALLDLARVLAQ
jgi:6-phosphofructokinase 1